MSFRHTRLCAELMCGLMVRRHVLRRDVGADGAAREPIPCCGCGSIGESRTGAGYICAACCRPDGVADGVAVYCIAVASGELRKRLLECLRWNPSSKYGVAIL